MNIKLMKQHITTTRISFVFDIDRTIDINKRGKSNYYKIYCNDFQSLTNFISSLDDDTVYLINPLLSISCKWNSPYLTLSRQFLITNVSSVALIDSYLNQQIDIARDEFEISLESYYLIIKYKKVTIDSSIIK